MKKIAIIGGGPSGIFCCIKLLMLKSDLDITVFDKSSPLATLLVTGNGRCNLAYNEYNYKFLSENYPRGEKFLYSIFSRYGLEETLIDFNKLGIKTYVQDDNRIFPKSDSAKEVRDKMLLFIKNKVNFVKKDIKSYPDSFDATVLATGLKSGAELAQNIGHKIIKIAPSLVGLNIKEKMNLEGVTFNNIIFTKNGVSGPYIYKLSSINAYKEFPYTINIPLINKEDLYLKVKQNSKKLFKNVVADFIPKSLASFLVNSDKQCANVSKKEIEALEYLTLTVTGPDNKGEIVHAGGVSLDEVDKNLKSKIKNNLWIIGELLNIDGFTGGFNLQACWSTASIAAEDIIKKLYP